MAGKITGRAEIQKIAKILVDAGSYKYRISSLFRDFITICAITLQNGFEPRDAEWEVREKEYLDTIARYDREMVDAFATCLGALINLAHEEGYGDHLGEFYMALGTSEKGLGQFFTPYHVSRLMAAMVISKDGIAKAVVEKGYLSVNEPTCGGGGMVVAVADAMAGAGFDPQTQLRVVAQDLDILCCRMTYVACVLHKIPAIIIWGDTLKMEERKRTITPALYLQYSALPGQVQAA